MWAPNPRSQVLINGWQADDTRELGDSRLHRWLTGLTPRASSISTLPGGLAPLHVVSLQDVRHGAPPPHCEAQVLVVYCFRVAALPLGTRGLALSS